jgi:hypothetical protein
MEGRVTGEETEGSVQEADLWRRFRGEFKALAEEQRELVRRMQLGDRRLRAYWSHTFEDMPVEHESFLHQKFPEYKLGRGTWHLSEGPNHDFRAEFDTFATRAALALRPPPGIALLEFWLHSLYLFLQKTHSGDLVQSATGIVIDDVCPRSARFCSSLERNTLEASVSDAQRFSKYRGNPEVAKRSSLVESDPDATAHDVCEIFDRERVALPSKWLGAGFSKWGKACRDANYRGRIQTMISKYKKRN